MQTNHLVSSICIYTTVSHEITVMSRLTVLRARALVLCDCRVGVMRGAKWLVRHKMAMLAWDLLKKDERAIVVATTFEPGGRRAESQIFSMISIRPRAS